MLERLMYFLHWIVFALGLGVLFFGLVVLHRGDAIGYGYVIFGVGGYLIFNIILWVVSKQWLTFPWSD